MKGLKAAIQKISSKIPDQCSSNPSDPRFCPGGRKRNFDFIGSNPLPDCCAKLGVDIPTFFNIAPCSQRINSDRWICPPIDCPVTLCFNPIPLDLDQDPRLTLIPIINQNLGSPMIWNDDNCFDFLPGDQLEFQLTASNSIPNQALIQVSNQTRGCFQDYGIQGTLQVNWDTESIIAPQWIIGDQSTSGDYLMTPFGQYQYNGGLSPISLGFTATPLVFNPDMTIWVRIGTDPDPANNPQVFPLVLGGNPTFITPWTLNPGEFISFEAFSSSPSCADYEIFVGNRSLQPGCKQGWNFRIQLYSDLC